MRKTLTFLAAATVATAGIGLPAWSAMRAALPDNSHAATPAGNADLIFVSGDDDGDDDNAGLRAGGDDDTGLRSRDHEDDDACEDDDATILCNGLANPAPAGTVAPPQNGLFGSDAAPQVQLK